MPSLFTKLLPLSFLIGFLTTMVVTPANLGNVDTVRRLQVAKSLWTDAPEVRPQDRDNFGVILDNGEVRASYGIGQSLLLLPFDIISTGLLAAAPISPALKVKIQRGFIAITLFPLVNGLACMAAAWLLLQIGFTTRQAFAGVLGLAWMTTFLHWAQIGQENNAMLLCGLAGFGYGIRWLRARGPLDAVKAATAFGGTVLFKATGLVFLGGFGLIAFCWWLKQKPKACEWREYGIGIAIAAGVLAVFVGIERWYHWYRFGAWGGSYIELLKNRPELYTICDSFPMCKPLSLGLYEYILSLDWGVFWHDPLLIVVAIVTLFCWKNLPLLVRVTAISSFAMVFVLIVFHARVIWRGTGWGARYIAYAAEFGSLLAVPMWLAYRDKIGRGARLSLSGLLVLGLIMQLASIMFFEALEFSQQKIYPQRPRLSLRLENIWAWMTDSFTARGLAVGDYYSSVGEAALTPNLFPFKLGVIHPTLGLLSWILWICCVGILAWVCKQGLNLNSQAPSARPAAPSKSR